MYPPLDLRQVQCFVAAAASGTMTAAASELHLSQSAVSLAVAGLERRLGVQLLIRRRARPDPLLAAAQRRVLDGVVHRARADAGGPAPHVVARAGPRARRPRLGYALLVTRPAHGLTHESREVVAVRIAGDVPDARFALARVRGSRLTLQAAAFARLCRERLST